MSGGSEVIFDKDTSLEERDETPDLVHDLAMSDILLTENGKHDDAKMEEDEFHFSKNTSTSNDENYGFGEYVDFMKEDKDKPRNPPESVLRELIKSQVNIEIISFH